MIRGDSATGKTTLIDMIRDYVIATRESLPSLPYSVEEIYGIRTSGKYGTLKQSYHEFYRLYGADIRNNSSS